MEKENREGSGSSAPDGEVVRTLGEYWTYLFDLEYPDANPTVWWWNQYEPIEDEV